MNILLIRTTGGVSGAEIHNIYLLRALLQEKHVSVHVLTNHKPFLQRLRNNHIPSSLIFFPIKEAGTKRELLLSAVWFLPMLILYLVKIRVIEQKKRFDTILLESMTEKLFLSPYLKLLGYRVVWIEHGPLFATTRSYIVKMLYAYKSKWPDTILAVSNDTKRDLMLGGVSERKIHVVYIGIDKIISHKPRKDTHMKNRKWTIGYMGSITKEKGIQEFLDTAHVILQKKAYAYFLVIGAGPLLGWAKRHAQELKIRNKVVFTGYVNDVKKYLKKIDILFFPTRHHEGISMALVEAMAMGKIVVARDIGGNRELVINRKTGFLFRTKEEGEKILEEIISGRISTEKVRKNALEHIRNHFFLKTQIPKFIQLFHG